METKELIALEEQLELIGGTVPDEIADSLEVADEIADSLEIKKVTSVKLKYNTSSLKSLAN